MIISNISRYIKPLLSQKKYASRPLFDWLGVVFNKIDLERIQQFGPDRVCAEWCLKNGASVQWLGENKILKDYNGLPPEGTQKFVQKIDATDSSISHHGFLHLRGCNSIREIILKNCEYIENDALTLLSFVKNSLEYLQVSNCGNISDPGLLHLKDLTKLKTLELFQLDYVKDKKSVIRILQDSLPNCKIVHDFEANQKTSNVI